MFLLMLMLMSRVFSLVMLTLCLCASENRPLVLARIMRTSHLVLAEIMRASHLVSTKLKHQLTFKARLTVHCEHRWAPNFTLAIFTYALVRSCISDRDRVNPKLGRSLYGTDDFDSIRRLDCFWIFLPRDLRMWVSISNAVERDISSGENILVHRWDVDYWWSWKKSKVKVNTADKPSRPSGRCSSGFEWLGANRSISSSPWIGHQSAHRTLTPSIKFTGTYLYTWVRGERHRWG